MIKCKFTSTKSIVGGVYWYMRLTVRAVALAILIGVPTSLLAFSEDAAPYLQAGTFNQQVTFRIGERIPLELVFTGPNNKRFEINLARYDRSGRMSYESFEVVPSSGWSDPLEAYFGSASGMFGGGIGSSDALSEKPTLIQLNLNEWIRFDRPGTYDLIAVSNRITDLSKGSVARFTGEATITLRSNVIHLSIVPATATWQKTKLTSALEELRVEHANPSMPSPRRQAAIADVRFLGTSAAADFMAKHLREDEPTLMFEFMFGLIGLPAKLRPYAITAMEKLLADPRFPVSAIFLNTIPVLQLSEADPVAQAVQRQQLADADWALALQALPSKEGAARAATVQALQGQVPANVTSQMKDDLGRLLASSLPDLPVQAQINALRSNWDSLRSMNVLPILAQLSKVPLCNQQCNDVNPYDTRELKAVALERWYELDPVGARQEALNQIGSANPSLTAASLAFLPKEKLPEYESVWANEFMTTDDYQKEALFASLMAHFGNGSSSAQVAQKLSAKVGEWACEPEGAALGYLVKFDPETARPLVARAVKERGKGKTACNHSVFQDIARYATDPILIEAAIEALNDPDPEVANDALIYLMDFGDKSARQTVWNRYLEWSEKWQGHADLLDRRDAGSSGDWQQAALGQNLARTLLASQGWLADPDLISQVVGRCVGELMCRD